MAYTLIQQVKLEVADLDPAFPLLSDADYDYLLLKHNNSVVRAAVDAARIILLLLSQRTDESIDVFSIRGSKSAEQMRLAIELYLKDPANNPLYKNLQGFFGGVSISDMAENNANLDNNIIQSPSDSGELVNTSFFTYAWRR